MGGYWEVIFKKTDYMYMKYLITFLIIVLSGNAFCQRLQIGVSQTGVHFEDKEGGNITQCEYGKDCERENLQYSNKNYISLGFEPNYLLGNLGTSFTFLPKREHKVRLINFPKDSEFIDVKVVNSSVVGGLFLNFGDKYWDSQDIQSLKLGLNFTATQREVYYHYKNISYDQKNATMNSAGFFISYDTGNFSFIASELSDWEMVWLEKKTVENENLVGHQTAFKPRYVEYIFAYSIYF
jgi:hypothetical protein